MNIQILLIGNYGINNLGDEAICAGMLNLLRSAQKSASIVVLSSNPKLTSKLHQCKSAYFFPAGFRSIITSLFSGKLLKTFNQYIKSKLVVLGGGGLFSNEKGACFIWFMQVLPAILLRKKLLLMAQSFTPLQRKKDLWLLKFVLKRANLITVRDEDSQKYLKSLGFRAQLLTDAVLGIAYNNPSFYRNSDYVVLSLRQWKGMDENLKQIADLIDYIFIKYQWKTVFLPHQINQSSDLHQYDKLQILVKNKQALVVEVPHNYERAIDIIGRAKLVIGMRLHSIIFSLLTKTPFLALSYDSKVKGFVKSVELSNFVDLENLVDTDLQVIVDQIIRDEDLVKNLEKQKMQKTYLFFQHEQYLSEF